MKNLVSVWIALFFVFACQAGLVQECANKKESIGKYKNGIYKKNVQVISSCLTRGS